MKSASTFGNSCTKRYAKKPIPHQTVCEKKLKQTQNFFDESTRVLEFGCETGSTALTHATYAEHMSCIDFSENMISIAKQKATLQSMVNVDFEVGTRESIDSAPRSFDVILGLSALQLIEDWQGAKEKVYSLLKPRWAFISSPPLSKPSLVVKIRCFSLSTFWINTTVNFFYTTRIRIFNDVPGI